MTHGPGSNRTLVGSRERGVTIWSTPRIARRGPVVRLGKNVLPHALAGRNE